MEGTRGGDLVDWDRIEPFANDAKDGTPSSTVVRRSWIVCGPPQKAVPTQARGTQEHSQDYRVEREVRVDWE
jgi:hypothetical protein